MSYSRTVKFAALLGASVMLPSAAFANCGTTCNSGHSSHSAHSSYNTPALSSWSASSNYVAPATSSYSSGSTYSGSSYAASSASMGSGYAGSMGASNCPSGTTPQSDGTCLDTSGSFSSGASSLSSSTMSRSYAAPSTTRYSSSTSYGSGSISATYSDSSASVVPFTGSTSMLGLGANESLVPTDCPVSVYNPGGGKVLGCYAVSKPAPVMRAVTTYTRVVHPVIYVRYPVPTPVPYIQDVYVGGGCGGYNTRYGAGYPGGCGW